MRVYQLIAMHWMVATVLVMPLSLFSQPSTDNKLLQNGGMRTIASVMTKENGKEVPLKVRVIEGDIVQVVVGYSKNNHVRNELTNWIKQDARAFKGRTRNNPKCTKPQQAGEEGIPDCETVRDFREKLNKINLRYIIEGDLVKKPTDSNSSEIVHALMGFCARDKNASEATHLCIDNINVIIPTSP